MPMHRVDLGEVPYPEALTSMAQWVEERREGRAPDRLFLLSHPPVITYGRNTARSDLPADSDWLPLIPVDRGGHATYHGPGQLIGYLIMDLHDQGPADVVRWLENGLIAGLASLGFESFRRDTPKGADSLVGIWTPSHPAPAKLVSIGMRIRGGVTSHGFALNVDPDLSVYARFTACSLDGVPMTSLRQMSDAQGVPFPSDAAVRDAVAAALTA
jgi:lipoyl(octanoyl) transferase